MKRRRVRMGSSARAAQPLVIRPALDEFLLNARWWACDSPLSASSASRWMDDKYSSGDGDEATMQPQPQSILDGSTHSPERTGLDAKPMAAKVAEIAEMHYVPGELHGECCSSAEKCARQHTQSSSRKIHMRSRG
jgi:hypothetical protein